MIPKRGYFQPIDVVGQIGWLWWGILIALSGAMWIEVNFKFNLLLIIFTIVSIAVGLLLILRRRIYIAGGEVFLGRIFLTEYEQFSLTTLKNVQLKGQKLSFERAGRQRKYWVSRNIADSIRRSLPK